ncbi:PREDICTED: uncharacterized protein LOC108758486 [Trachymyrmex cornetzi]|uniref:uncharacterized protein LOC108758486 n=1 Tax=Trachymyrmex cornetzi TaxID=471704 RepID=UPI00084F1807|nr:PREDICTED: uncharacterized protein LOC108758486 [Trachymyrmex cornetzi]
MFESLVACNDTLSNTQKFHYLKTSVTGDAAIMISNLKISEANYESAWQLLIEEYDDKQTLVYTHLHAFAHLPIMKTENVNDLRKLHAVASSLAALKNLERPVDTWDDLLVYIMSQKFSPRTRNEWNLKRTEFAELPSYKNLNEFLTMRIRGLSDLADSQKETRRFRDDRTRPSVNNVTAFRCVFCSARRLCASEQTLFELPEIRALPSTMHKQISMLALSSFASYAATFRERYETDVAENSSRIRAEAQLFTPAASNAPVAASSNHVAKVQTVPPADTVHTNVLLATAWVDVHTVEGRSFKVRALLDQGSTFSFISQALCQTLRTKRQRSNLQVTCFGEKYTGCAKSRVMLTLTPCARSGPGFPLHSYVFQSITSYAASQIQPFESWSHLHGLSFADPDPSSRHRVHLLIGPDLYGSLLKDGLRQGPIGTPTAQLTALGWILSGPAGRGRGESAHIGVCHNVSTQDTNTLLKRFWEDEERLRRHAELSAQYQEFLAEYLSLGHMSVIDRPSDIALHPVYIPHHPVVRESSSTTKLRVVFNASCKTTNGTSLKNHLLVGPKLQQDLSAILLRWRQWRFVYMADIAKMFRQILVNPLDADFQRILWRPSSDKPVPHFRLLTVHYIDNGQHG